MIGEQPLTTYKIDCLGLLLRRQNVAMIQSMENRYHGID